MSPDALTVAEADPGEADRPDLPAGWALASLQGVTAPVANIDPRKGSRSFTYIDLSATHAGTVKNAPRLEPAQAPSRARQLVRAGDVLFSGVRVYLRNIAAVGLDHDGSVASTAFCVLRPNAAIDSKYLFHFVSQQKFINSLFPLQRGNSPPAVLDGDIKAQPLPLPPLAEQRRIVARIDELFAEIAEGEAALERARRDLDTWRRALLKAAVTGELTRDWRAANRPAETGADLLARIQDERDSHPRGNRARRAPLTEVLDIASLPTLPTGWIWVRMGEIILGFGRNGISVKGSPNPPGTAALRLDALRDHHIDFARTRYIQIPTEKARALLLSEGDFLISRANGSAHLVGRACLVRQVPIPCVYPDTIIRYRIVGRPILAEWLEFIWESSLIRGQIAQLSKTTAGILKISQEDIGQIAVPIGPIAELYAALNIFRPSLAAASDALDAIEIARRDADGLRDSVLKAAFEGRLVPQDPADEPASVLLARLRANDGGASGVSRRAARRRKGQSPYPSLPGLAEGQGQAAEG